MKNLDIRNKNTFLLLGSNINPKENIKMAIQHIDSCVEIIKISNVYQTRAILGDSQEPQPDYLNVALKIIPQMDYNSLFAELRKIETNLGRKRSKIKFSSRTIDIDIVMIEGVDQVIDDRKIPDPDIVKYSHLFLPLNEIASELIQTQFPSTSGKNNFQMDLSNQRILGTVQSL